MTHSTRWLAALAALAVIATPALGATLQPQLGARSVKLIQRDNLQFKDLNKNGALDPYEDWRLSAAVRSEDLLRRMSLEQKAGSMVHGTASAKDSPIGISSVGYDLAGMAEVLATTHTTSLITRLSMAPRQLAEQNNRLQQLAETSALGIPLSISTDPRSHFQSLVGAASAAGGFSQWPEALGFGAIGDAALVESFADIVRREYRATGIHIALSPQADLATEPRWPRLLGTFGENPQLAASLVGAYVRGMQNGPGGLNEKSVVAVVKHWVGYGAAANGFDAHNFYGRFADLSASQLALHIRPFEGAFEANVASVMPTYAILRGLEVDGRPMEPVGGGFNRWLLTDLLREKYGFKGLVLSDWAITENCNSACREGNPPQQAADIGMPWGVEQVSKSERFVKGISAGVDQFGGTTESGVIVAAVRAGKLTERRLDDSVRRVLLQKFQQGLFEDPYVDPSAAQRVVGSAEFVKAGRIAQQRALVLLQNEKNLLPLRSERRKVFLKGVSPDVARSYGFAVVEQPASADFAIVRVAAPSEMLHPRFFFGSRQHEGSLAFDESSPDYQQIVAASALVPTVVVVFLDRPAILTNVRARASAMIGDFGASDAALLDVLTGRASPGGHLPIELPASMSQVEQQSPGTPSDSGQPLYPLGWGLSY